MLILKTVSSDNEPSSGLRKIIFRRFRADNLGRCNSKIKDCSTKTGLDRKPIQICIWNLYVGVSGSLDQSSHSYDVRYVSAHSGN